MTGELACANAAADILKKRGKVFIGYITAGLEPYSAQQKPDISFVPAQGPNAGRVFFIELRLFESVITLASRSPPTQISRQIRYGDWPRAAFTI
jgi:hypothetical protein